MFIAATVMPARNVSCSTQYKTAEESRKRRTMGWRVVRAAVLRGSRTRKRGEKSERKVERERKMKSEGLALKRGFMHSQNQNIRGAVSGGSFALWMVVDALLM